MISGKRVIAVIPARGGSKSIPRKNLSLLGGRPLLAWAIRVAKVTTEIDRIIVSTDDREIAAVAAEWGAEVYWRPPHLASDDALVIDALRELRTLLHQEGETADLMVLLEPTCPLRRSDDVRRCLSLIVQRDLDSVATFREADLNPHRAWRIEDDVPSVFIPGAIPWLPRQKQPQAYQLNGAVYAFRTKVLAEDSPALLTGRTGAVVMPKARSIDIDDALDLEFAEAVIRRGLHESDNP